MDIEKPQRKTVQWNAEEINTNLADHHKDFKKKVFQFQTFKSKVQDESQNSNSDEQSMEEKSEKTIEMESNLKKAKVNRISLNPGAINLNEINRRISVKQNIVPMDEEEEMDEESMMKKAEFEMKKIKVCNESFPVKKKH